MEFGNFMTVLSLIGLAAYQLRSDFENGMEKERMVFQHEIQQGRLRNELAIERVMNEIRSLNMTMGMMEEKVMLQDLKIQYLEMSTDFCRKDEKEEFDLGVGKLFSTVTTNFKKQYSALISYLIENFK